MGLEIYTYLVYLQKERHLANAFFFAHFCVFRDNYIFGAVYIKKWLKTG